MPLTPFHIGPAVLFGLILFRFISLPAFVIGSVIVDIEPFFVLLFGLDLPLHGFFHSFVGGSVAAFFVFFVMMRLDGRIQKVMEIFRVKQESSSFGVLSGAFLGVYLHIFLDSFLYTDIRPFFPAEVNPLYGLFSGHEIYLFCVAGFVFGIFLYGYKVSRNK